MSLLQVVPRRQATLPDVDDLRGRGGHVVVLPEPKDGPTSIPQVRIGAPVTTDVASELLLPPRGVVRGRGSVLRARVPEAAVDEDCDARS